MRDLRWAIRQISEVTGTQTVTGSHLPTSALSRIGIRGRNRPRHVDSIDRLKPDQRSEPPAEHRDADDERFAWQEYIWPTILGHVKPVERQI
jgi:hypothetical protein